MSNPAPLKTPFVHLRTHSCYSFLEGLPMPAELAHAAASQGMPALALTDHRSLSGSIEFFDDCKAVGIQPILGLELDVAPESGLFAGRASGPGNTLVLLATGTDGWRSLCRLSSIVNAEQSSDPYAALPVTTLAEHAAGLICLSGGRRGLAARLISAAQEKAALEWLGSLRLLFPDSLYAELQVHTGEDAVWSLRLASLAHSLGLPTVATHDVHYLHSHQSDLQRTLTAVRLNTPLRQLSEDNCAPPQSSFVSADEMSANFAHIPRALENTLEVASRCRFELALGVPRFPELDLPPGRTAIQELRSRARTGLHKHYPVVTPAIQTRLDHELSVIEDCGYAALFLVMEDILRYARESGVPFSSRGSAASSLVAHCLEITSPDPIRLNLYFERFLNPARATPPDIDTDLCSRRRDDVIRYVYEHFGSDRVAMICTVNRFQRRSALREVGKAHGLPPSELKEMADSLPYRWRGPQAQEPGANHPFAELLERYSSSRYEHIFAQAAALIGLPRHLSIHPGGMVISPCPLTDVAPTMVAAKGVVITQFDHDSIERLGLVKIDLLGIRGLTVMGDVADAIGAGAVATRSIPEILDAIPEDDPETALTVQQGRTIGCFQIESPGMRTTLKEIQARSIDDIMVALALYRPGPLTGGLKSQFVRRHLGLEQPEQLHPALSTMLDDTYGVILYQEQVLRIAHELAGLGLVDADLLRRAMSHFDPGKEMQNLHHRFITGARDHSGVPEETAEQVWALMAAFAGYGFPKAHAASYAQIAWRSAWCKTHHPAIFLAAVLANWGGYYRQSIYLNEARRLKLGLRPPHVNHASAEFSVRFMEGRPVLFMGLNQVHDLTRRTQSGIMRRRPFNSLPEFLSKVDPKPVEAENLIRCGALAGLGTIPELLRQLEDPRGRSGQLGLFSLPSEKIEEWSLPERVSAQEAVLGVGVDAHRLELYSKQIAEANAVNTLEANTRMGERIRVAGMKQILQGRSGSGGKGVHLVLEDLEGMLDVFIPLSLYHRSSDIRNTSGPFVIEGMVEADQSTFEPVVVAERVWVIRSIER